MALQHGMLSVSSRNAHGLEVSGEVNKATAAQLSFSVKDSSAPPGFAIGGNTSELQSPIANSGAPIELQVPPTDGTILQSEISCEAKRLVKMNKITFPLNSGMQGPEVANLQDALLIFLERSIILPNNEAARREMSERLKQGERVNQFYGDDTLELVTNISERAES